MKILSLTFILLLVSSLAISGVSTRNSYAEIDPSVLLDVASNAQEQVSKQLSRLDHVPPEIQKLNEESQKELEALEEAVRNDDLESAKEHFMSSMRIFKEIAQLITVQTSSSESREAQVESANNSRQEDVLKSNLQRMKNYVDNLREITAKHEADIDFEDIDRLFEVAQTHLEQQNFEDARKVMNEIKKDILDKNKQLREKAAKQTTDRAKEYAKQYLQQLDRLINILEKRGSSEDLIDRLHSAREKLANTSDPKEIIQEVRNIISIKKQFELTKIDRLESRVIQVERNLQQVVDSASAENKTVNQSEIDSIRGSISEAKTMLYDGKIEEANELLKSIVKRLQQLP